MSPLVRLLLALAALLAAADAQNNCHTEIIGRVTDTKIPYGPVDIPYGDANVRYGNYCPIGMHTVGEMITVCNNAPGWGRPDIFPPPYTKIQPVHTRCYDPDGCTAFGEEYCDSW